MGLLIELRTSGVKISLQPDDCLTILFRNSKNSYFSIINPWKYELTFCKKNKNLIKIELKLRP